MSGNFQANQIRDLSGYIVIVTGGNSGIGFETSLQLAKHHARVYIANRSQARAREAIERMRMLHHDGNSLDLRTLSIDLMSLSSVKAAAAEFKKKEAKLDLLINNAGIMAAPFALTKDGFETQWQVNCLAPLTFTLELLPLLEAAASESDQLDRARVVNLSADAAFLGPAQIQYHDPNLTKLSHMALVSAPWRRYGHSKLASIIVTRAINDRYKSRGVTAYSLHPGVIRTPLQDADTSTFGAFVRVMISLNAFPGIMSIEDGARTTLFCATSPEAPKFSGQYFAPFGKVNRRASKWIDDSSTVNRLWDFITSQIA